MGKEDLFYKRITKDLNSFQVCFWFKVWGSMFQVGGIPDIIMCLRGKFVAIELKGYKKGPTKRQKYILSLIRLAGGITFVAYPENWDQVYGELKQL